jgi:hypothetical protein
MEEDKKPQTMNDQFFEVTLQKIREIRRSKRSITQKLGDTLNHLFLVKGEELAKWLNKYQKMLGQPEYMERFTNLLMLHAEVWMQHRKLVSMSDIEQLSEEFSTGESYKQDIYNFPSFQGDFEEDEDGGQSSLPEELKDFKGSSMVLKIEDIDRFMDTFCSRDTYYRRAYAILAELDKQVLECVEDGVFPEWTLIPYKDDGDAIFQFSHFEVDLREPDEKYRTLYVVYRYDTTVS